MSKTDHLIPETIQLRELEHKMSYYVNKVKHTRQPIIVTKHRKPVFAIIDLSDLGQLIQRFTLNKPKNLQAFAKELAVMGSLLQKP